MSRRLPYPHCLLSFFMTFFFFTLASSFVIDPESSNSLHTSKDSQLLNPASSTSFARSPLQSQEETQEDTEDGQDSKDVFSSTNKDDGDQYDSYDSNYQEDILEKEFYLFKIVPKEKLDESDYNEFTYEDDSGSASDSTGSSSSSSWFSSLDSTNEDDFEQIGVFEYGELTTDFLNCNPYKFSRETCLVDTFTDRAEFEFIFSLLTDYQLNKPTVLTSNESVLKVYIEDFDFDMDDLTGGFNVRYHCLPQKDPRPKLVLVTVELSLTPSSSRSFSWLKECIGAPAKQLQSFLLVEYLNEEDGNVYLLSEVKDKIVAEESDPTTSFYISLQPPATQIEFKAPQVTVKNKDITTFSIRGASFGGVLTQSAKEILIIYKCLKNGVASFKMVLEFPSYDNYEFSWEKKCDVNAAEKSFREMQHAAESMQEDEVASEDEDTNDDGLNIDKEHKPNNSNKSVKDDESVEDDEPDKEDEDAKNNVDVSRFSIGKLTIGSKEGLDDIYSEGRVRAPYDFDYEKLQVLESSPETENAVVLSATDREISFHLTYHGERDVIDLPVDKVSFTVGSPTIAVVTAKPSTPSSLVPNGDVLLPGDYKVISARIVCLKKGRTKIMASLTVELIGQIEFGFVKDCVAPRRIQKKYILTASLLFKVLLFLLVVLVVVSWKFGKKSRNIVLQQGGQYAKSGIFQPSSTVSLRATSVGDQRSSSNVIEEGDRSEEGKKD